MSLSQKPLDGRVAIVTGSSRRIGRATALALADAGAAVVINASKGKLEAQAVADEITAGGGRAIAILADVAQPDQAAALVQGAIGAFGRLDILINNAAVGGASRSPRSPTLSGAPSPASFSTGRSSARRLPPRT